MKQILNTLFIALLASLVGFFVGQRFPNAFKEGLSKVKTVTKTNPEVAEEIEPKETVTPKEATTEFSRKAVIQINPLGRKSRLSLNSSEDLMTRNFFKTQFHIIRSDETVNKAITEYQLDKLWGMDKADLLKGIKLQLQLSQIRGTDLLEIKATFDSDEKAQQLAYAVAMSYGARRSEGIANRRNEVIEKYKEKIKFQEDKVSYHGNRLYKISKELSIPYHGIGREKATVYLEKINFTTLKKKYDENLPSVQKLEGFLKDMQDLDDKALIAYIRNSNRPEAKQVDKESLIIQNLKTAKQKLLAGGLDANDPKVHAAKEEITKAEVKLIKHVRDLRNKLIIDFTVSKHALDTLKTNMNKAEENSKIEAEDYTKFGKVKDEYEREFRILQSIKQAELSEVIVSDLDIDPLKFHEYGWTQETAKMMAARKK